MSGFLERRSTERERAPPPPERERAGTERERERGILERERGLFQGNGNGQETERAERERARNGEKPERGLRNGLTAPGNPERVPPERDPVNGSLFHPERASRRRERELPEK